MKNHCSFEKVCLAFLCVLILSSFCSAQNTARYLASDTSLEFRLSKTTLEQIKAIYLFNSRTGITHGIALNRIVNPISTAPAFSIYEITLQPAETLSNLSSDPATLTVVIQPDQNKDERVVITIPVLPVGSGGTNKLSRVEAESRDDADVYVSGEMIAAHDQKPEFSADVKLQWRRGIENFPARYTPFFELTTGSSKEFSDKLNTGVRFSAFPFTNFRWEGSGEIEADRKFKVTNFITSQELKYLVPAYRYPDTGTPKANLFFRPSIGAELGKNLKTSISRDVSGITRLKAGASLVLNIFNPFRNSSVKTLTWENSFVQRWFLLREQAYDTDDDGKLILRDFGRRPRSHFSSDLQFKLNDFFGPTLSYEWGELPPLYKKVNHRLKLGFTFSFKRDVE